GYVTAPNSEIASEFSQMQHDSVHGVFSVIELPKAKNNRMVLLNELKRIYDLGWITSKRLDANGGLLPCRAPNCGGYTLEAELGVTPNGYSEPDFMGWEVKQFGVANFNRTKSKAITLMTPEPTDGLYKAKGAEFFVRTYGYKDKLGRPDRLHFGGVHKVGEKHHLTNLTMQLIGFDNESGKIRNSNGKIALLDENENETASWSFVSMLKHWNRKHNQACYVPSLSRQSEEREYRYGNEIILGTGTDFPMFLSQMANGNIYYDPGIKLENISTEPKLKKRSQFRIKSGFLPNIYKKNEIVNISE
uniref:MvaI/BcnI family restriction endonuclease n=1 Tax=Gilvibacter sp. TaxID=2729997 RepID=UPI0035BE3B2F